MGTMHPVQFVYFTQTSGVVDWAAHPVLCQAEALWHLDKSLFIFYRKDLAGHMNWCAHHYIMVRMGILLAHLHNFICCWKPVWQIIIVNYYIQNLMLVEEY